MKKLLFAANTLDLGGIEKALVTWLNYLASLGKYELVLVLEKNQGIFLEELDKKIKIIEYAPSHNKVVLLRKIINAIKRFAFIGRYKNKFDFAVSFATYSHMSSFVARTASKKSALWGHADYLELYQGDKEKMREFFENLHYEKFKKFVFVSEEGKNSFISVFPEQEGKVQVCNNLIDADNIKKLANEEIDLVNEERITFLNVGRHEEIQKRLTRLIEASKKLKQDGYDFRVLMVGAGPDNEQYRDLVTEEKVDDTIFFLGSQKNPYPYFKFSDAVILTSDYEGYPVVFLESMVLERPIITTAVSGSSSVESGGYGIVTKKSTNEIYKAMKQFIEKGYTPKKFDAEAFNKESKEKMQQIIEK